jgi:hypothetical protein
MTRTFVGCEALAEKNPTLETGGSGTRNGESQR